MGIELGGVASLVSMLVPFDIMVVDGLVLSSLGFGGAIRATTNLKALPLPHT